MIANNKVLVLCREPGHLGGVTNYCNSIFKYFKKDSLSIERFIIGRRLRHKSNIYWIFTTLYDYIRFFIKLFKKDYVLVHLNPSLGIITILRDSIFLLITKLHRRKVLVYWHGWSSNIETKITDSKIIRCFFIFVFKKADAFAVLASSFKEKLRQWGLNQNIFLETTAIDNQLLHGFSPELKIKELIASNKVNILFFSRIAVTKGIFETLQAFLDLDQKDIKLELLFAGNGPDYKLLRKRVNESKDDRIKLVGYVRGEEKKKILHSSHLMCFPTYYGEGLPVSLLEAMAFAMPVITRPVGGIPDNFTEGKNGYYLHSLDTDSLSTLIKDMISDKEGMARIAFNNYKIAKERFIASTVVNRLTRIYKHLINGYNYGKA